MAAQLYCDLAQVLVSDRTLSVHRVSRAVYDAVPGRDELHQQTLTTETWSKIVSRRPIVVRLFTYEAPEIEPVP